MKMVHVYFKSNGRRADIIYKNVQAIRAGTALQLLGDNAAGNGIPDDAAILQIILDDGNTATFDANNVTILFN